MLLLDRVISQLPEASFDLPSKVVMIKELLPWKMLWLCFYCWHWQFELLKEIPPACVTKAFSSPLLFFSGKSADLPEGLWQGVVDSFSIIPFQKYYPSISGNTVIAFYILTQIPDKWLLSSTVKHQTLLGEKLMKFQRSELEMFCLSKPSKFLKWQRQGISSVYWQWHHGSMYLFFF